MTSAEGEEQSSVFEHPDIEFDDDDNLMVADTEQEMLTALEGGENFIERDDFEREMGSVEERREDFTAVSQLEIVELMGDDKCGRPIVVIYACRFPSNKTFDHQQFLRYLTFTLDRFVEQDYTIVYFHYGLRSHNKPPMRWLLQTYKLLDRRYKKNLKALYLVHPTQFIRLVWNVFRPFISVKFEQKLHYVNYVRELDKFIHTDQLHLPSAITQHDATLLSKSKRSTSAFGLADETVVLPTAQFGVTLEFIMEQHLGHTIPPVLVDMLAYLRATSLEEEGIFRRSANLATLRQVQTRINEGEAINFHQYNDTHLVAALLKTFLRELREPVIPFTLYPLMIDANKSTGPAAVAEAAKLVSQLPKHNYNTLEAIVSFLTEVVAKSDTNLMNANNMSVVFGPNLTWPLDQQLSLLHLRQLNTFAYTLISQYDGVFNKL